MEATDKVYYRFGIPTNFDQLPCGSLVYVTTNDKEVVDVYIQCNSDETNPEWKLIKQLPKNHA
jgi:hypothetical protein